MQDWLVRTWPHGAAGDTADVLGTWSPGDPGRCFQSRQLGQASWGWLQRCQSFWEWAAQGSLEASTGDFEEMAEMDGSLVLGPVPVSGGWREQSWIMAMWLCKSLEGPWDFLVLG